MFGFLEITKSSLGLLMMLKERYVAESGQKNTPIKTESPAEVDGDSRQRQDALKT